MDIADVARKTRAVAARRKKQAATPPGAVQVPVTTNGDEPGNPHGVPDMPRPGGSGAPGYSGGA